MTTTVDQSNILWTPERWIEQYSQVKNFWTARPTDLTRQFIERFLPQIPKGNCLEIGCYPGQYLAFMGDNGFALNGIDLVPGVQGDMRQWLVDSGYNVQNMEYKDFFEYRPSEGFDLVYSLGFVEHFVNWADVLKRHAELVKPGGYLIVTCPNFRGILQHVLRILVDIENLKRHHLPSMKPEAWRDILKDLGFEIIFSGYFGGFAFWVEDQKRNIPQRALFRLVREVTPLMKKLIPENNSQLSAFCGVVARRTK